MNGNDIYTEKSSAERNILKKEFSRLYPLPTAWKIILPIIFSLALIGNALQVIFLATGREFFWMSATSLILYGTWLVVYSVYGFCVMLKRNKKFFYWLEKTQQ